MPHVGRNRTEGPFRPVDKGPDLTKASLRINLMEELEVAHDLEHQGNCRTTSLRHHHQGVEGEQLTQAADPSFILRERGHQVQHGRGINGKRERGVVLAVSVQGGVFRIELGGRIISFRLIRFQPLTFSGNLLVWTGRVMLLVLLSIRVRFVANNKCN